MLLLLGQDHFSVEKMHEFDVFNECVTDQPTDRPTDTAYYRDARTHLKRKRNINKIDTFLITITHQIKSFQLTSACDAI